MVTSGLCSGRCKLPYITLAVIIKEIYSSEIQGALEVYGLLTFIFTFAVTKLIEQ